MWKIKPKAELFSSCSETNTSQRWVCSWPHTIDTFLPLSLTVPHLCPPVQVPSVRHPTSTPSHHSEGNFFPTFQILRPDTTAWLWQSTLLLVIFDYLKTIQRRLRNLNNLLEHGPIIKRLGNLAKVLVLTNHNAVEQCACVRERERRKRKGDRIPTIHCRSLYSGM